MPRPSRCRSAARPAASTGRFVPYRIASRLHHKGTIFGEDFAFLKSATKATPKLTIPSPSMMHYPGGRGIDRTVYPDMEQYFDDLAEVYIAGDRRARHGSAAPICRWTTRASRCSTIRRAAPRSGEGAETDHLRYIELFNTVLRREARRHDDLHASVPRQFPLRLARGGQLRACRRGDVQRSSNVDGFFLEYDDARSGDFAPLRFVPEGPDGRARPRHHQEAGARSKGRPQAPHRRRRRNTSRSTSSASRPQCGFASTAEGNLLTMDDQIAKLRLVVETARRGVGLTLGRKKVPLAASGRFAIFALSGRIGFRC